MTRWCPVSYDHDNDPCAVCGWDPDGETPAAGERSGATEWIGALNLLAAQGWCAPSEVQR